jgi:hypothetical protein
LACVIATVDRAGHWMYVAPSLSFSFARRMRTACNSGAKPNRETVP